MTMLGTKMMATAFVLGILSFSMWGILTDSIGRLDCSRWWRWSLYTIAAAAILFGLGAIFYSIWSM